MSNTCGVLLRQGAAGSTNTSWSMVDRGICLRGTLDVIFPYFISWFHQLFEEKKNTHIHAIILLPHTMSLFINHLVFIFYLLLLLLIFFSKTDASFTLTLLVLISSHTYIFSTHGIII